MRVLVAMSGGVDSSVAAARLVAGGHQVVGATLRLWGGESSSGCCSVGDVEDARAVARHLGIDHHVFNMADDFASMVVGPYVAAHAAGRTPNPCIECNRRIKFDRLLGRARRLGFDALATGHHARVERGGGAGVGADAGADPGADPGACADADAGPWRLRRGADPAKDQSYVLSMLGQAQLARLVLPVGCMSKEQVRAEAARGGLATAGKPDSQDVCFVGGPSERHGFLSGRLALHPGRVVDTAGVEVGSVEAVELVTVGQRRGMGAGPGGARRYVTAVDIGLRTVTVAVGPDAAVGSVALAAGSLTWTWRPLGSGASVLVQVSAHGVPAPGRLDLAPDGGAAVTFSSPQRPVAPGQTVALYDPDDPDIVVGAGLAA